MKNLLIALLYAVVLGAQAQTLTGLSVSPEQPKVGDEVKITASFDVKDGGINCGVRVKISDGTAERYIKINQAKDVPMVLTHSFKKAGDYAVTVEPRSKMPTFKCSGEDRSAKVTVADAVVAKVASAAPASASKPACPEGWALDAKSVNKKSGAFACKTRPGTAAPATKLDCGGNLGYYENIKTGRIGCQL
jgi:hypothetical protein